MDPIYQYFKNGALPLDPKLARKLKHKAVEYALARDILYKRSFNWPMLRCVDKQETDYVMKEVNEGMCGNHQGRHMLAHRIIRQGYY